MTTPRPLNLSWDTTDPNASWTAACGCSCGQRCLYHPEPFPHVHACCLLHQRPDLNEAREGHRE